jgi:hypothetical protein
VQFKSGGAFGASANFVWDNANGRLGIGTAAPSVSLAFGTTDAVLLPAGTTAQEPAGVNGMIRYNSTNAKFEGYQAGAWQDILTGAASATPLSGLTVATQANTIDNAAWAQNWQWNALAGGNGLALTTNGTAALTGQTLLNISASGANATGAQTTYGESISNTHTGTSTNVGLYATASGGTANYAAIFAAGNVGIGNTAPAALLDVGSVGATLGTLRLESSTAASYVQFQPSTTSGAATYTLPPGAPGVSGYVLSSDTSGVMSWVSASAGGIRLDQITAATANNTPIDSAAYTIGWKWNSLTTGNGLTLGSSSLTSGNILFVSSSLATASGAAINGTMSGASNTGYGVYGYNTSATGWALYANGNLGFDGQAARTLGLIRETTAAGNGLSINAGGAVSGGTDLNGGNLVLQSGTATGNASSSIAFQTVIENQGAGAADRVPATSMILSSGALTIPAGNASQQPGQTGMRAAANGMIRYNTSTGKFEMYENGAWKNVQTGSGTAAGSTTQVQFNSGGAFGASANFVWDNANGRLGIGTAAPGPTLDVQGTAQVASSMAVGSSPVNTNIGLNLQPSFSPGTATAKGGLYILPTLTSSLAQTGDYYGIDVLPSIMGSGGGTAVYGVRSTGGGVAGTVTNVYDFYARNPSGGTITNKYGLYVENITGGTTNNYALYSAGGQSYLAGNVGIGTATPAAALDVQSAVTASGGGVAYGLRQQQTLTAAANNNALYGLYLNTTYANGAFTGVTHTDIGFNGTGATPAPRVIAVDRNTTAATAGFGLTVSAGGAKLAGTDKAGGDLTLSGGTATGTADSKIIFKGSFPQASTNTTDNAPTEVGRITGGGYVQFTGTYLSGDTMLAATGTATPGAGTRMVWYPKKAAFRAGFVSSTQWDDANIGNASTAFGNNTTASGNWSTVFGNNTTASGAASAAFGTSTTASGINSAAWGFATTASGYSSTALGSFVKAGDTANVNGLYSMAIGLTSTATANYADLTGNGSLMIAMQDQHNVVMAANNAMALLGGSMIINPATAQGAGMVSTPDTALDVRGSIKVGDGAETCGATYAGAIRYNTGAVQFCNGTSWANIAGAGTPAGSDTQVQFNSGGAFGASANFVWDNTNGRLGIGTTSPQAKLDVAGEVRIGNTSLACSGTTEGAQRYNSTSHNMEVCNGTAWLSLVASTCDNAPAIPIFADQTNLATSTLTTSNIVLVTGMDAGCAAIVGVSGTGGSPQYRVCSDAACSTVVQNWTSSNNSIVMQGLYIQLEATSSASVATQFTITLSIGPVSGTWNMSTGMSGCAPIGTVCSDGTVYAGLSGASTPMYATPCDAGQTWSGSACTGTRLTFCWNNCNSSGYTTTSVGNSDGQTNTATLVVTDSDSITAGVQQHLAAQYCKSLSQNSHSDWYLPAQTELNTLYTNKAAIGNFDTSGTLYWTSTEYTNTYAWSQRFSDGNQNSYYKYNSYDVRCVRR